MKLSICIVISLLAVTSLAQFSCRVTDFVGCYVDDAARRLFPHQINRDERATKRNGDMDLWAKIGDGDLSLLDAALTNKGYTATTDFPSVTSWRELLRRNPNAKVVLTVRDAAAWYESCRNTIFYIPKLIDSTWVLKRLPFLQRHFEHEAHSWNIPFFGAHYREVFDDRKACMDVYNKHVEEVKKTVPASQLLLFDVKEGWGPLCKFLDKPVPSTPFPKGNETAAFERRFRVVRAVDIALTAVVGVVLAGAAYYFGKGRLF